MPLQRRDVHRALVSVLGFQYEEGTRHGIYVLRIGNRVVAKAMTSRGSSHRTLSDVLVSQIAREVHCDTQILERLVRGTASRDDYMRHLLARGIISVDDLE